MRLISSLSNRRQRHRLPRATLPWAELEAEADRQGCSAADVLFDRAGRPDVHAQAPADPPQPPRDPAIRRALRHATRALRHPRGRTTT